MSSLFKANEVYFCSQIQRPELFRQHWKQLSVEFSFLFIKFNIFPWLEIRNFFRQVTSKFIVCFHWMLLLRDRVLLDTITSEAKACRLNLLGEQLMILQVKEG